MSHGSVRPAGKNPDAEAASVIAQEVRLGMRPEPMHVNITSDVVIHVCLKEVTAITECTDTVQAANQQFKGSCHSCRSQSGLTVLEHR